MRSGHRFEQGKGGKESQLIQSIALSKFTVPISVSDRLTPPVRPGALNHFSLSQAPRKD